MARLKKPINYIEELLKKPKSKTVGEKLRGQYYKWIKSLKIEDFCFFLDLIEKNRKVIGLAQFFGKFRAYSFEEYVYRLLKQKCSIPEKFEVYWGEKCRISKPNEEEYCMEADIIIGKKQNQCVKPKIVIDTKVELDASRFKNALASFMLIKRANLKAKCFLVYLKKEVDEALLHLADFWIDGIYNFSWKVGEIEKFLYDIQVALKVEH